MPDVEWIMENCYMMRDNGVWAGEKQISYASPDGQYTYYVNKRKDVVSLANQGMAVKNIAKKLGLHYNQVYYYLNKHQIPYKKREFRNQSNNLAWKNLNDMVFMRRS